MSQNIRNFYRRNAMNRLLVPFGQGEMPTGFRSRHILALGALTLLIVAALIWSLVGEINENIYGTGIVTLHSQFDVISSPGSGVLISLDVQRGDAVYIGQMIGRVFSNNDLESMLAINRRLEKFRQDFEALKVWMKHVRSQKEGYYSLHTRRLDDAIARIEKQLGWYDQYLGDIKKLAKTGIVSQYSFYKNIEDYNDRLKIKEDYLTEQSAGKVQLGEAILTLENDLWQKEQQLAQLLFESQQKLRETLYNSRVISQASGTVTNINISVGDMVSRGTELIRLMDSNEYEDEAWELMAYFSAFDAKKIKPGMRVLITPSTVKAERDGSIYGTVTFVEDDLETPEALTRRYRNSAFGEYLFNRCDKMPVEVRILLSYNSNNPSGFNWTNGRGPDIELDVGTICSAGIAVEKKPPLELIFSHLRRFIFGQGLLEEANRQSPGASPIR